jgi:hypothetical protein
VNNTNQELKFFWVVALRPEANALIKKFNLKSFSNHLNFPIYINRKNGHALVISGVGSIKSAVATMYLNNTFNPGQSVAWINIGIAGHFQGPVGTLFQAIKVVNNDNGKSFFPGLRFSKLAKAAELYTVSSPENEFTLPVLYDMEAAGFCEIAPSLSCNELTFVLKIVSDTSEQSQSLITKKMIADLFKKNSAMIDNLLQAVVKIVDRERARLEDPIEMDGIMCSLHFTETNRLRFRKIYKKWWCLFPNKSLVDRAQKASSAHDLMQSMELDIASEAQSWKLK